MSDKRSVSTDALETLGTIIGNEEKRDAIHLAVEAVEAREELTPGEDIGIVDGLASRYAKKKLGIVDPFLREEVRPGQRFWLIVYPRQITSLRHVWTHPDFPEAEIEQKHVPSGSLEESTQVLKDVASEVGISFKEFMDTIDYYASKGSSDGMICFGNDINSWDIPEDFWDHYETVTGSKVSEKFKENAYFRCAC